MLSPTSKAYRAKAKQYDFYAVCLVGWAKPRPMDFGDNEGVWPVKIVIRKKESEAAKEMDLETPHTEAVVLEHVLVESFAHATRLKDALNEVLLGQQEQQDNKGLRRNFRTVVGCWEENDLEGRALWFAIIVQEALRILKKSSTSFHVFDADEAYKRIAKSVMGRH